ncbi:MAG: hypothetical protein N3E49_06795 [Bacteroidia bacterium]|nr:hypothetical protein [Bacteroidia bacterium]
MRKVASLLVGSAAALSLAAAQSRSIGGGAGWFSIGYTVLSGHNALRDALRANGLSVPASPSGIIVGGGGGGYLSRIFLGGYGEAIIGGDLGGGYGLFRLGYLWRLGSRLVILPTVGIGGGRYGFTVSNRPEEVSFVQAIDPAGGIPPRTLSTSGIIGGLGLSLQYFSAKGPMVGLELGYSRGLGGFEDWGAAGVDLRNGPEITPTQLYVRLLVGGGAISSGEGE